MKELLRQIVEELENVHVVASSDRLFELIEKAKAELDHATTEQLDAENALKAVDGMEQAICSPLNRRTAWKIIKGCDLLIRLLQARSESLHSALDTCRKVRREARKAMKKIPPLTRGRPIDESVRKRNRILKDIADKHQVPRSKHKLLVSIAIKDRRFVAFCKEIGKPPEAVVDREMVRNLWRRDWKDI